MPEIPLRAAVKGHSLRAADILNDLELARAFVGGPVLLARLSPMDYHNVYYFDDGETLGDYRLGQRLWTVNGTPCKATRAFFAATSGSSAS